MKKDIALIASTFAQIAYETFDIYILSLFKSMLIGLFCCSAAYIIAVILLYTDNTKTPLSNLFKISFSTTASILLWQISMFIRAIDKSFSAHSNPTGEVDKIVARVARQQPGKFTSEIEAIKHMSENIEAIRNQKLARVISKDPVAIKEEKS